MQRQLAAFVEEPCKATYLAARDAVLSESPLALMTAEIADLDLLLEHEEHQMLLDRLDSLPPSKVLSPRIHFLAAEAAAPAPFPSAPAASGTSASRPPGAGNRQGPLSRR